VHVRGRPLSLPPPHVLHAAVGVPLLRPHPAPPPPRPRCGTGSGNGPRRLMMTAEVTQPSRAHHRAPSSGFAGATLQLLRLSEDRRPARGRTTRAHEERLLGPGHHRLVSAFRAPALP